MYSFTYNTTPREIINQQIKEMGKEGPYYRINCRVNSEDAIVIKAVAKKMPEDGSFYCMRQPDSLKVDRLHIFVHYDHLADFLFHLGEYSMEGGEEAAMSLRTGILETLGIEEI